MNRRTRHAITLALLLANLVLLGLFLGSGAEGETLVVDPQGHGNARTINEALHLAHNEDTIRVYEGVYRESVVVNKSVTLQGAGPGFSIVQGEEGKSVFTVTADWVNISGFTLKGHPQRSGLAGILLLRAQRCSLSNNSCLNSSLGISLVHSDDNLLEGNRCLDNPGIGISLVAAHRNRLKKNICTNNIYGIRLCYSHSNLLSNNSCRENLYGIESVDSVNNSFVFNDCSRNDICAMELNLYRKNHIYGNKGGKEMFWGQKYYRNERLWLGSRTCTWGPKSMTLSDNIIGIMFLELCCFLPVGLILLATGYRNRKREQFLKRIDGFWERIAGQLRFRSTREYHIYQNIIHIALLLPVIAFTVTVFFLENVVFCYSFLFSITLIFFFCMIHGWNESTDV